MQAAIQFIPSLSQMRRVARFTNVEKGTGASGKLISNCLYPTNSDFGILFHIVLLNECLVLILDFFHVSILLTICYQITRQIPLWDAL